MAEAASDEWDAAVEAYFTLAVRTSLTIESYHAKDRLMAASMESLVIRFMSRVDTRLSNAPGLSSGLGSISQLK